MGQDDSARKLSPTQFSAVGDQFKLRCYSLQSTGHNIYCPVPSSFAYSFVVMLPVTASINEHRPSETPNWVSQDAKHCDLGV